MNNNQKRLIFAFVIAVFVLSVLFSLLPKTSLIITAYCFSLLAPIMFFGTLWVVASRSRNQYITNAAFALQSGRYCALNLIISILFVFLDRIGSWSIPAGWFALIHILLLAFFAWRILAMRSGQEEIERVEKKIYVQTIDWRTLVLEAEELRQKAGTECKGSADAVFEAIRYADPMSHEALTSSTEEIRHNLKTLALFLEKNQIGEVRQLAETIRNQVKIRNEKCKLLK